MEKYEMEPSPEISGIQQENASLFADKQVEQLFTLLVKSDRSKAHDYAELIGYVDSIDQQLTRMTAELAQVRGQLAEMRESPTRKALSAAAAKIEANVQGVREKLTAIKTRIVESAAHAVESVKKSGLSCLSKIASFLPVKEGLNDLRSKLQNSIDSTKELIGRVEAAGTELRSTGESLKNAGRAVLGKEAKETKETVGREGGSKIIASLHTIQNTMENMGKKAEETVRKLEALDRADDRKPSVRQDLAGIKRSPVKVTPLKRADPAL